MAHRLDIDSIHQNSFLLLNIAYGAKEFAQSHHLSDSSDEDPINGRYYVGWLRFVLSDKLVDTAIKTRIMLDMVRAQEELYKSDDDGEAIDSRKLDKEICSSYNIASASDGETPTIRECCNKIIHAIHIQPLYEDGEDDHHLDEESDKKRGWKYWSGSMDLSGLKSDEEWHFELHVSEFCTALEELVSRLEETIDWQTIHFGHDALE
jgi:hypothetical protein